ncbi:MAG: hypothetical protein O7C39_02745 [Bacteroidetes bacterium]|nr:hypothetical protein [Bacteroidota bacterium]
MTEAIEGEGTDKSDEIVVTWFANSDARKAFENDPEFKKLMTPGQFFHGGPVNGWRIR